MTEFWLKHPQVLFKKENIHKLWPYDCMTFNEKLNATTRFIILITLVGYAILGNYTIMLFSNFDSFYGCCSSCSHERIKRDRYRELRRKRSIMI